MTTPLILLFLKAPVPGKVKTRLAADVGEEVAVEVYRQLVEQQLRQIPSSWRVRVVFDPPDALPVFQAWLGQGLEYCAQAEGDLGDRLHAAVTEAFSEGASSVFCIGGDCPNLGPDSFNPAQAHLLEGKDVVFVPAEDGGYVLIALSAPCPELFHSIPWSTGDTLRHSVEKARQSGRRVEILPPLYDIDTRTDLERAVREHLLSFSITQTPSTSHENTAQRT